MTVPLDRPFTRQQAIAAGLTDTWLRRNCRQLFTGIWVHATTPDSPLQRARGALLGFPAGAVATHTTAARLRGVPVPPDSDEHVTVARRDQRRRRRGVRCHLAALRAEEIRVLADVPISAPARMFIELASMLDLVDLVVVGDWLVSKGRLALRELVDYCAAYTGRHAEAARQAASYVRERVESPMETRLRMLLVLAGLPEPEINREVRDPHGLLLMRLDLRYPEVKLAVEYDGRHHATDLGQWERDGERRADLEDEGWRLITIRSNGIYREPERTIARVRQALLDRGWGTLPPPSDAWRAHFRR